MSKPKFYVNVTMAGHDPAKESRIEKLIGRGRDSSGFDFTTGERDMQWNYTLKNAAYKAAHNARKVKGVKAKVVECTDLV